MSIQKSLAFALLLVAVVNTITAMSMSLNMCPDMCEERVLPVCGTDGESYEEFSNACELNRMRCMRVKAGLAPVKETDMKWCTMTIQSKSANALECPESCFPQAAPVCGTDGKVFGKFSNVCELKKSNCHRVKEGLKALSQTDFAWCTSELVVNVGETLGTVEKPECFKPCVFIYEPICISNGKYRFLVSSKCQMEYYNCALATKDVPTPFKVLSNDSC